MCRIALAPCSPFSVTRELMAETAQYARSRGVRMHTHMAETVEEEAFCLEMFGMRPVEYLEELGWLGDDVWLAHCVHLNEHEIARFGETGTGVAHCPSSNARLGAGIAPVVPLMRAGAPVGLGVDGAASNEAGELGGELRQALLVARLRGGPAAMTCAESLELGTLHGARCLGRDDELGTLEAGKLADVVLWRLDDLDRSGIDDPVAALVLGPRPLPETVIVDGRVVVSGRRAAHRRRGDDRPRARGGGFAMSTITEVRDGVGASVRRPDGIPKVKGEFAYSSDMWADDMLWGATLRSPHPRARIKSISLGRGAGRAGRVRGADPRGRARPQDVRARAPRPAGARVQRGPLPGRAGGDRRRRPSGDRAPRGRPDRGLLRGCSSRSSTRSTRFHPIPRRCTRAATCCATSRSRTAPEPGEADVVVTGEYEVGMQDQAFLGPESGLALPAEDGGVDLFIATQWLHVDRDQVAAALDLPLEKVRFTLAGVGGAFGGREDVSMQIHACLLALHTGRPVKMVYGREESFFGHVHRHPARMRYEHGATRDGRLAYIRARILLDGGAYASSSTAVCSNAASFALGPYAVPSARIDAYVVYTDNPPCGAMRGFGAVQTCFAHEAQMDKLAAALEHGPGPAAAAQRDDDRHLDADRRADQLPRAGRGVAATGVASDRCPRAAAVCPAGSPTSPAARAWCAASAMPSVSRMWAFPRVLTTSRRRGCGLSTASGEPLVEVHTAAARSVRGS